MLGHSIHSDLDAMKTQSCLELSDVRAIAAAAEAEALQNNWAVSIAIVDAGGHLLHFTRLDGAPPISSHIAPSKAHTAALGRRESKVYEDVINGGRASFLSAPSIQGMLEGLDPHSFYIASEEMTEMEEQMEGSFEGVGIEFNLIEDTIYVVAVISGGPSEEVGIQAGDRIVKIEDETVAGVGIVNHKL